MSLPSTSAPNSPDAKGKTGAPAPYSWTISSLGITVVDTTPPRVVGTLHARVKYRDALLSWRKPADQDFDHVTVSRLSGSGQCGPHPSKDLYEKDGAPGCRTRGLLPRGLGARVGPHARDLEQRRLVLRAVVVPLVRRVNDEASGGNGLDFFVGNEVYDHLEKVVDRFDDVANVMHGIVIEHV